MNENACFLKGQDSLTIFFQLGKSKTFFTKKKRCPAYLQMRLRMLFFSLIVQVVSEEKYKMP